MDGLRWNTAESRKALHHSRCDSLPSPH